MKKNDLARFEELLKAELESIEQNISESGSYLESDEVQDFADMASVSSQRHLENGLQSSDIMRREQILAALKRVQEGTYGKCVSCGGEIELERLEYIPYATRCVACKSAGNT